MRTEPRVLVIGAGSAGIRHALNLQRAGAQVAIMDPKSPQREEVQRFEQLHFDVSDLSGFDGVVVASPSTEHFDQAEAALRSGAKVLVEKPLATSTEGLEELVKLGAGRIMVGYNLRLHEPIERAVEWFHSGRVGRPLAVRVWFGYYLPLWRPGSDYRDSYSAHAASGGGVLLDAIHELDLLIWLLGPKLEVVAAVLDRVGDLEIDVEDTVRALVRGPGRVIAEVSLDYLSRRYRRGIEIVGDRGTLRLDWSLATLEIETAESRETLPVAVPVERSYEREAAVFLDFVRGEAAPPVDAPTGAASVRLAAQIRNVGTSPSSRT